MTFRERAAVWVGQGVSGLTWVSGGLVLAVAAVHLAVGDGWIAVVWLHTVAVWILPLAGPVLAVAIARRKRDQAVPPGLALAAWVWCVRPPPPADPPADGTAVRVVSANVLMVNDDPRALIDEVVMKDADILLLQEFTPSAREAMAPTRWVTRLERPAWHSYGLALYSRFPLVSHRWVELAGVDWLRAVLDVHGTEVEVWNAHTLAPFNAANHRGWRVQIEAFARAAERSERPVLLVGDLNLTPHHAGWTRLMGPFDDAWSRCGRWGAWTWPANAVHLDWFPRIRIDHVLLAGPWACRSTAEGVGAGSDHRPIIADLVLTQPADRPE